MNNLNYIGWKKVAATLAGQRGFGLRYVSEAEIKRVGAQAWNDGKYAYVRQPDPQWSDAQFRLWLYQLVHEIGHSRPGRREVFDVLRDKRPSGLLSFIHNLFEDHVQELDMYGAEPVLRDTLVRGRAGFYEWAIADTASDADKRATQRKLPQGPTLFSWDAEVRANWNQHVAGMAGRLRAEIDGDPQVETWLSKLRAGPYAAELAAVPDVWEVYAIAERVLKDVFGVTPEQCKPQQDSSNSAGDGDQQQGDGDGAESDSNGSDGDEQTESQAGNGEASKGNDDGQGESGDAQGAQSSGVPKDSDEQAEVGQSFAQFDYSDMLSHDHAADTRSSAGVPKDKRSGGCAIDYEKYFSEGVSYQSFTPDFESLQVFDCTIGEYPDHDEREANPPVPESQLTRKVSKYMQAMSRNKRVHGQKSGKLSNKNLYRLRTPGISKGQRERVFSQRIVNKSKDVAVSIGIDLSGSMEDYGKAGAAIAAVTHLHSVIHQALHIPLEITGFSTLWRRGAHAIIQSFEHPRRNEQVEDDLRRLLAFPGSNRDGEWLMWARERLLRQKASRHILLVLSDGQPVHLGAGDVAKFTKDVARQIDADPRIDMYAIGILSDQVRNFYQHCEVINHVSELEEKLLTVLRDKIIINL